MINHDRVLSFSIDAASGSSKQTQIREFFVKSILSRRVVPGEALPSTRQLSQQLRVSRNTVILAYQALMDSGYIEAVSRSGFIVSPDAPVSAISPSDNTTIQQDQVDWGEKFIREPTPLNVISKPLNWREYQYPFTYGQIDARLFSHSPRIVIQH